MSLWALMYIQRRVAGFRFAHEQSGSVGLEPSLGAGGERVSLGSRKHLLGSSSPAVQVRSPIKSSGMGLSLHEVSSTPNDAKTSGGRRHSHFLPDLRNREGMLSASNFAIDEIVSNGYSENTLVLVS